MEFQALATVAHQMLEEFQALTALAFQALAALANQLLEFQAPLSQECEALRLASQQLPLPMFLERLAPRSLALTLRRNF